MAYSMLLELEEVLSYDRFQPRLAILQETPAQLAAYAMKLSSLFDVSRLGPPIIHADPDDDIFLLCASKAQASYVVTNDRHLRGLKTYRGISILALETFLQREFPAIQRYRV